MGDILTGLLGVIAGFALIPLLSRYDKKHAELTKENKKPYHKRVWMWLLAIMLVVGGISMATGSSDDYDTDSAESSQAKTVHHTKNTSNNLPGQKINKAKANKHDFYWTDKDDKKVRYFVNDNKKITAIKVVLTPDINNTTWCQAYMDNVLHDGNLKYGNDKEKETDIVLSNDSKYNIYSPKYKKWYWVAFNKADGDEMVSSFSIYPEKNSDAQ